jgi:hypothetical protein
VFADWLVTLVVLWFPSSGPCFGGEPAIGRVKNKLFCVILYGDKHRLGHAKFSVGTVTHDDDMLSLKSNPETLDCSVVGLTYVLTTFALHHSHQSRVVPG